MTGTITIQRKHLYGTATVIAVVTLLPFGR